SYSFYAERRPAPRATPSTSKAVVARMPKTAKPRKLTFKEKHELAGMEATIEAAEARVGTLERTLQDPAVFKERGTEVRTLVGEPEAAGREGERLYAGWEDLSAIPAE